MIILIHSSKTMRSPKESSDSNLAKPELLAKAVELNTYLKTLSPKQLMKIMAISAVLANKTHQLIADWTSEAAKQSPAVDTFLGDIYSGLQVDSWNAADREYANKTLSILSGLYGVLRPLDGISPYRLEMGYRLLKQPYANLYRFWGKSIADTVPAKELIVNLAAVEYSKTITDYVDDSRVVTPNFLTVSPKTGEPTFVVVHAKIARGAFASWLIRRKITEASDLRKFTEIGYTYSSKLSTEARPVFVCQEFGGKGLSVRLSK